MASQLKSSRIYKIITEDDKEGRFIKYMISSWFQVLRNICIIEIFSLDHLNWFIFQWNNLKHNLFNMRKFVCQILLRGLLLLCWSSPGRHPLPSHRETSPNFESSHILRTTFSHQQKRETGQKCLHFLFVNYWKLRNQRPDINSFNCLPPKSFRRIYPFGKKRLH